MKQIFIILILSFITAQAGSVKLNIRDRLAIKKSIEDSAKMFVNEIDNFLKTPMDWCSLEPTGESDVYQTNNPLIVELSVTAEFSCNETKAYQYFRSIVLRYKKFVLANPRPINLLIRERYPSLAFSAIMMNHTLAISVNYNLEHGQNPDIRYSYFNKTRFFRMVLNDEFTSPDVKKIHLKGCLISTHTGPRKAFKHKQVFTFRIYKKTLAKNSVIRFDPIYHPTEEEAKIAKAD